eukprot:4526183-Amphidinium_carterae.1
MGKGRKGGKGKGKGKQTKETLEQELPFEERLANALPAAQMHCLLLLCSDWKPHLQSMHGACRQCEPARCVQEPFASRKSISYRTSSWQW